MKLSLAAGSLLELVRYLRPVNSEEALNGSMVRRRRPITRQRVAATNGDGDVPAAVPPEAAGRHASATNAADKSRRFRKRPPAHAGSPHTDPRPQMDVSLRRAVPTAARGMPYAGIEMIRTDATSPQNKYPIYQTHFVPLGRDDTLIARAYRQSTR